MLSDTYNDTVYDRYSVLCGNILTYKLRQRYDNVKRSNDDKSDHGFIEQPKDIRMWSHIPPHIVRKYHREQSRLTANAVKYISLLNFKRKSIIPSNELFYILFRILNMFELKKVESNPCITYQEKMVIYSIIENSTILKSLFAYDGIHSCNKVNKYCVLARYFNENVNKLYEYANVNKISVNSNDKLREITLMDEDVKSLSLFYNKQMLHINKKVYSGVVKSYTIYTDSILFVNK